MKSQAFSPRPLIAVGFVIIGLLPAYIQPTASAAPLQASADSNSTDPDRQQAMQLYDNHKMPEAAALFEKVVAKYPKDMVAHELFGVALLSRADIQTNPEDGKADRLHARAELLRARELGDNSDLCKSLLAMIHEDGSQGVFSDKPEANGAMTHGEAAFAKGEWREAIKEYSHALELDPSLYLAAVDIGDSYFRLQQMDTAGVWFAKAVQIDSNQEVAYRYWGDALMQEGKMKEAREKFIEGLVASPYRPTSWNGLHNWLTRNHLMSKDIPIKVPAGPTSGPDGQTVINIDAAALTGKGDSSGAAWMMYPIERSLWRKEKFAKEYPQEKKYRHSLKEEVAALSLAVSVFQEKHKKRDRHADPGLSLLSQFETEGMLEPYVLLMDSDEGIDQDYADYRAAHRDKLIAFVDKYVIPSAP